MTTKKRNELALQKDIGDSVDFYNRWFVSFAPSTFAKVRETTLKRVERAFAVTNKLTDVCANAIELDPATLEVLRMTTAPPIARDRLIGLSGVKPGIIKGIEKERRLPKNLDLRKLHAELNKVATVLTNLQDRPLFPWVTEKREPSEIEFDRAATIVADRLCGTLSDPIIRNEQEHRQLIAIRSWLEDNSYKLLEGSKSMTLATFPKGYYAIRFNLPTQIKKRDATGVNVSIDVIVKPHDSAKTKIPILIEAKSAGDFTNTNKRRKEESDKLKNLRKTYGKGFRYVLFLAGYFDLGYLKYESGAGIEWVWEHRKEDLAKLGL